MKKNGGTEWDEKLQPNLMWPGLEFLLKLLLLLFFYIDLNIEEWSII
jgi:hypothetical protein